MAEVYGHKWVSQYGEVSDDFGALTSAAKTWAEGLAGLGSLKQQMECISHGFAKMVKQGHEWPPSLPQFLALCHVKRLAPYHRMAEKALPPPRDTELALSTLREIRSMMTTKKSNTGLDEQSGESKTKEHLAV
jgi:hypothetical protein